ncbi:MAG: response regulator transcription factor [Thermoleophilia bacterium]|nr:response regulator transcription factor [Thermoleophilia bacterium]
MGQAARMRVLLVDDDQTFLVTATEVLDADGRLQVVGAAHDGDEALALVDRSEPDLVLMDIGLPLRDGVEVTRLIRARRPELPVVMLTGQTGRAVSEAAAAVGAIGYLQKEELGTPEFADSLLALVELSS